jgi:signal transduction histidine kinase
MQPDKYQQRATFCSEYFWEICTVVLLLPALAAVSVWLLLEDGYITALLLFVLGLGVLFAFTARVIHIDRQMRCDLAVMQRRYQDMFGRAGISIWQEDWSAVAEAIESLRQQGVEDIVGWYADHPKAAHELHAKVLVTDVNSHGCYLMKANEPIELIGSLPEVLPGSFASFYRWLNAICAGKSVYVGESRIQKSDGEYIDCFVTAALPEDKQGFSEIMLSVLDITGYKRDSQKLAEAREELIKAQRLITAGALTASIAHEINSPLAAVSINAAACLRWLKKDPPDVAEACTAAGAALEAIDRTQAVVSHTKSYFTRGVEKRAEIDLKQLVRDTLQLIETEAARHKVEISVELAPNLKIQCDPVQIQQAVVNLCINAIQAMSDSSHSRHLQVKTTHEDGGVTITVEDSGPGIESTAIQQIFDPFYSTKNDGMGMGLAISQACAEAHGGRINVSSTLGAGTRFELVFPSSQVISDHI